MSNPYGGGYPDSNEGGGSYGYPNSGQGGGNYGYPTDPGPYQGYPVAPQADGSLQPQDLGWRTIPKGKIGGSDGTFYNCAHWGWRVLAGLIDYGPLAVLNYAGAQIATTLAPAIGYGVANLMTNLIYLAVIALAVLNSGVLQGMTAQSIGKKVLGLQLVRGVMTPDGEQRIVRPGVPWAIARLALHIVDAFLCYLGFFAPLWTQRRQTFADMIVNTAVLKEPEPIEIFFAPSGSRRLKL
jgi:uncharacterized RDD family membrane protein YckC